MSAAKFYDPATNDYDITKDPRCLWGWGDCGCMFGHACFREFGHEGACWDGGDEPDEPGCEWSTRPADWDERGRAEANR